MYLNCSGYNNYQKIMQNHWNKHSICSLLCLQCEHYKYFFFQIDEFPVNEAVALQLAGLQAQVLWGTFDPNLTARYDEIEQFVPLRIIQTNKSKTREDWKKAIGNAHKVS